MTNFTSGAGTQTLPIWIFSNYQRPNQLPLVNVAAVLVLVLRSSRSTWRRASRSDPAAVRRAGVTPA